MKLCDESKYLEPFLQAHKECDGFFNLTGDVLLVEKVTGQEYKRDVTRSDGTKTQIYLSGGVEKKIDGLDMNLPMFVRVLAVGPGFYDESNPETAIGCEVEAGDIILIGRMSVNWFSVFGSLISTTSSEIGLTRESEVRMRFKGQAAYDKYFEVLNNKLSDAKEKALQLDSQNRGPTSSHSQGMA